MSLDIDKIKKIILDDSTRRENVLKAKKYYDNETDIQVTGVAEVDDIMRKSDNRISHNFHQLMVDEKASYMFSYPVLFDIDTNSELNNKVRSVLDDEFESISQELCIESANTGIAWLHYWINDEKKLFEYAIVETEQIIPIYNRSLKKDVKEIYRYYSSRDEDNKEIIVFEHWTEKEFDKYIFSGSLGAIQNLIEHKTILHNLESVPFIPFPNNKKMKSDLDKYKNLIDIYDKVVSGFANDLEDIQQIIYIIENYEGTNLGEFTSNLKRYKAIHTDSSEGGGGVKTLQIEIPVEARKILLEMLKKQIYEAGQALQQDNESFGNASGVALKFFYRKLELKSGFTETEFKKGFSKLIKAILKYLNVNTDVRITQTYTRNMISNDVENSDIAKNSVGIIPTQIILKNHPWVEDPEEALKLLDEENKEIDIYENIKTKENEVNE
ncbi:MAG: phage portal protein [Clostridium sp.]